MTDLMEEELRKLLYKVLLEYRRTIGEEAMPMIVQDLSDALRDRLSQRPQCAVDLEAAIKTITTEEVGAEFGRKDCGYIERDQAEVVIDALIASGIVREVPSVERIFRFVGSGTNCEHYVYSNRKTCMIAGCKCEETARDIHALLTSPPAKE